MYAWWRKIKWRGLHLALEEPEANTNANQCKQGHIFEPPNKDGIQAKQANTVKWWLKMQMIKC